MPEGVVVQGPVWESCEAILWSPCSSSQGIDMPGEESSEEGLNHMARDMNG